MEKPILYVYNTKTQKKEKFKTIDESTCSIYSCGPTVYNYAHIGNFRYFLFIDLLRRTLKQLGYNLKHVMNITDVGHLESDADEGEDKMQKASKKEKKSPWEIAEYYKKVFLEDALKLNIDMPENIVDVSKHIKEMEEYVLKIIENGYAYKTEDTVYFNTSKLDKYGVLSKVNVDKQQGGARVAYDNKKKNVTDFAIWIKAPKEHIMKWDSFFGKAYPGWHLECSVISNIYLGEVFDIHTGGSDHISIHHENEIAQSKGYSGKEPANYWMHSEFLQIDGGKMSKSLGNVYTVRDLEARGYNPLDFKYFTFNAHYRTKLNFTFEALNQARETLKRLRKIYFSNLESTEVLSLEDKKIIDEDIDVAKKNITNSLIDDLNISRAISEMWKLIRNAPKKCKEIATFIEQFDEILGLDITNKSIYEKILEEEDSSQDLDELPKEIVNIFNERNLAREEKKYEKADKLRDELLEKGYNIIDTKDGAKLEKL